MFCRITMILLIISSVLGAAKAYATEENVAVVPKRLGGQGLKLRFKGQEVPLENGKSITFDKRVDTGRVHLLDEDDRTMSFGAPWLDRDVFEDIYRRNWFAGVGFGESNIIKGDTSAILLRDTFENMNLFLVYQPSSFGCFMAIDSSYSDNTPVEGVTAKLSSVSLQVAPTYEWIPIRHSWMRDLHLSIFAGVGIHSAKYVLADDFFQQESLTTSPQALIGSMLRYPVVANFWVYGSLKVTGERWHLREFNYNEVLIFEAATIGGSYAF